MPDIYVICLKIKGSCLNISNWDRKEHYYFFKDFEEPFFGVTVNIDCTKAYRLCKEQGYSFFLYYLHKSLVAVNRIDAFRYRIEDDAVCVYDVIHSTTTVLKPDNTFGFAYLQYEEEYELFEKNARNKIEATKKRAEIECGTNGEDVIHYSTLPWLHFTSVTHARMFSRKNSCPKITFGKMIELHDQKIMPVSIVAHHALMNSFSVGEYVGLFQELI